MNEQTLKLLLAMAIPLLFAITIHEYAHGFVADRLGDKTARMLGRLSLNPLNHIDPFGTLLLPICLAIASNGMLFFGYAKPVPISVHNFKNIKRDLILVTLAGPGSNFLMAFLWLAGILVATSLSDPAIQASLLVVSLLGVKINIFLGVLNLLPIPPLDGSKVITVLMPRGISTKIFEHEQYGILIIMALAFTGILGAIIGPIGTTMIQFYLSMIGMR
jgi:Zn-dependent protease